MPEWLAPFHLPKFTDDKFEKAKDAYNRKNGYVITVPSLGDIIHLRPFPPLTKSEQANYRRKHWHKFSPARLNAIRKYKADRRSKYLAMLASPSPKIVRDAGAILTALDDLQDALSTLSTIGLIAATIIGGSTAAVLAGPLGWIIAASTVMSLINPYSALRGRKRKPTSGRGKKKLLRKLSDKNPFSKKARMKVLKRMKNFRPTIGNLLEVAQTTDGIFGIGVSLGPIMGFVQDLAAGAVRKIMGQKVTIKKGMLEMPEYAKKSSRALKAQAVLNGQSWRTDLEDLSFSFIAGNLAMQALKPFMDDFNPFEDVPDLNQYEVMANKITNPIIQEIILEAGHTLEEYEVWPQNGKKWISYVDLYESTNQLATDNLNYFGETFKHENLGFLAANNAHDFSLSLLESVEGPGTIEIEYSHAERIVMTILDHSWMYPEDVTDAQIKIFEDWVFIHEFMNTQPSGKEIQQFVGLHAGFQFVISPDAYL